jgi:hypothetical protein
VGNDSKEVEVRYKITPDLILELYNEIELMEDPKDQKDRKAVIDVLSEHIGEFLVTETKSSESQ